MRVFHVHEAFEELPDLPATLPAAGYLWVTSGRREFEVQTGQLQEALQRWGIGTLVDLHVSDLLNHQLPSQFDYTSWYDLLVFRRLAAGSGSSGLFVDGEHGTASTARQALESIDTSPVGFALFDRLLVTVHPTECQVRDFFVSRLSQFGASPASASASGSASATATEARQDPRTEGKAGSPRLPPSPADLMLRIVNHMVDSYLELRRLLTRQLGYLQGELLNPRSRFDNWQALLESRNALHQLEDTCEDQRSAVQEWIDALAEWPPEPGAQAQRERELLRVRSRDVLEHIERVLGHVRRLESSAESAVQMHFSAQANRTNDIMRTLTVLTAVFMPLTFVTGFFGMNFEFLPLIHSGAGFWITTLLMALLAVGLVVFFRRKRYLEQGR